jgi:tRNA threonylcarbamoyladenosine biosynthesis protein TsaB
MSQVYLQVFDGGVALMAPDALDLGSAAARLAELHGGKPSTLIGSGAPLLAETFSGATVLTPVSPDPVAVARLAAAKPAVPFAPAALSARALRHAAVAA